MPLMIDGKASKHIAKGQPSQEMQNGVQNSPAVEIHANMVTSAAATVNANRIKGEKKN